VGTAGKDLVEGSVSGSKMVSLWDFLTLVCCVAPIGGVVAEAKIAKAGFGGYVLAITIALVLGLCGAWAMRIVGKTVADRVRRHPGSPWERYLVALYFAAILWMALVIFLGSLMSSTMLRLIS
jgi:uncharacterized membrane-anchored protein